MRKIVIFVLAVFSATAQASDPTGLIPFFLGFLLLVCIVVGLLTWLVTKSLPNSWSRFYIRVLSVPVILSIFFLIMGLEFVSIVLIVLAVIYILLYQGLCKWLM
jgi:hypothetical protein